jgi:hypothetical protein
MFKHPGNSAAIGPSRLSTGGVASRHSTGCTDTKSYHSVFHNINVRAIRDMSATHDNMRVRLDCNTRLPLHHGHRLAHFSERKSLELNHQR